MRQVVRDAESGQLRAIDTKEPEPEGLRVARRYARWNLGNPNWADSIIDAYLNPAVAAGLLDEEENES